MRTNLQTAFQVVRDVQEVSDPWGLGIVFEVYRQGALAYQKALEQVRRSDSYAGHAAQVVAKAKLRALVAGEPFGEAESKAAILAHIDQLEVGSDFWERMERDALRETAARLAGWRGVVDAETGAEVPFSLEAAVELFGAEGWVPEGQPLGGQSLGEALVELVTKAAGEQEEERASYVEGAAKNSEGSSSGAPESSAPSTT